MNSKDRIEMMRQIIFIAKAHHAEIEDKVKSLGLHRSANMVLSYLFNNPNTSSQKEIAEKFQISEAAVASSLDRLEKDGYIERKPIKEDRRKNKITVTKKGISVVMETREIFEKIDEMTLDGLSDEDFNNLSRMLSIIASNLSKDTDLVCKMKKEECHEDVE